MSSVMLFFKALKPAPAKPKEKPAPKQDEKPAKPQGEPQEPAEEGAGDKPELGNFSALLALLASHNVGGQFGPDNVAPGDHVAFKAGEHVGAGKVVAHGRDGLSVADKSGREHRVHWREVTGHHPTPGKKAKDADAV